MAKSPILTLTITSQLFPGSKSSINQETATGKASSKIATMTALVKSIINKPLCGL